MLNEHSPSHPGPHLDTPAIGIQHNRAILVCPKDHRVRRAVTCDDGWRRVTEAVTASGAEDHCGWMKRVDEGLRAGRRAAVMWRLYDRERCGRELRREPLLR